PLDHPTQRPVRAGAQLVCAAPQGGRQAVAHGHQQVGRVKVSVDPVATDRRGEHGDTALFIEWGKFDHVAHSVVGQPPAAGEAKAAAWANRGQLGDLLWFNHVVEDDKNPFVGGVAAEDPAPLLGTGWEKLLVYTERSKEPAEYVADIDLPPFWSDQLREELSVGEVLA